MYIVTGAAGFIGSVLVSELNARGVTDLLLVDDLGHGEKWKNLRGKRYTDLLSIADFEQQVRDRSLAKPAGILHMGACSSTLERNADYVMRTNYRSTRLLAEWALEADFRFIYASSAATYGDGALGFSDDVTQLAALEPMNIYGYSKHAFDLWAHDRGVLDRICGLKFFNVFGPNEYHKDDMTSMVMRGFNQVETSGVIKLFKSYRQDFPDGGQQRDFVYVKDCADVCLWLLEQKSVAGLFNVGNGRARSWNELADAVFSALGKKPVIEFVEMPEQLRDRYQYFTQAPVAKLRAAGYTAPMTSLEDATLDYVGRYLRQGAYF